MENVYILGAGGFAKEVCYLLKKIDNYRLAGFVDVSDQKVLKIGDEEYPVFSDTEMLAKKGASLVLGIGNPKISRTIVHKFGLSFNFPTIIHPSAEGDWKNISMGPGNVICSGVNLTTDIVIGSFNIFNLNTTIGHDVSIGDYNVLNPGANISGGVTLKNGILIGTNASILQYKSVGDNAIVGAGAVVLKDVPEDETWVGNPAKKIK